MLMLEAGLVYCHDLSLKMALQPDTPYNHVSMFVFNVARPVILRTFVCI